MTAKQHTPEATETPVVLTSEGHQLVGMWHQGGHATLCILCHGFTSNKHEDRRLFVETGRTFCSEGFDAFRFDFFGSGDSDGTFSESRVSHNIANLRDVLTWARQQPYDHIAVLGLSMGAATAILTLTDETADALITWSAVPDMRRLFESVVGNLDTISDEIQVYNYEGWQIERGFLDDALQYDVAAAFKTLALSKFLVQGTEDDVVFVEGFNRFRRLAVPPADFMEIPDAGHTYVKPAHRRQVIRQTVIWMKRHLHGR